MPVRIVDSSARLQSCDGRLLFEDLLREMDEWSVSHAVVAPSDEHTAVYNEEGNAQLAELVRAHPGRLSGLAVANPWYSGKAVETLESAFRDGLVGLYLHPPRQGFRLTDGMVDQLIRACAYHRKPVYSHTGAPIASEPFQLAELARRHPNVTFVMGHAGWSDFCGYDVIPAAGQAENIVVEVSCATPGFVRRLLDEIGPERVVFGSAYPRSRYGFEIPKIRGLGLDDRVLEKLLHGNAERLWGISA